MNTTTIHFKRNNDRIGFSIGNAHLFFSPEQIIRLESLSNYTYIYFTDHAPILMAKVLHKYETMLEPFGFIRTHRSHIVNTQYISAVENNESIRMCDASKAEISRSRRRRVLNILSDKYIMI